jgi:L-arabinonolactonase
VTEQRIADFEILAVESRDVLGEGPWWDVEDQRLWWVDIKGRRIRNATLDGREGNVIQTTQDIGFAVPDDQGGLFGGLRDGLYRRSETGDWTKVWNADYDTTAHRINDGKTDRTGRLWFGTMHDAETAALSSFYRYDQTGVKRQSRDVTASHGRAGAPNGRIFYYTDSLARTIWTFDFDPDAGVLSNRQVFACDPVGYVPDGLTVDVDGAVWAAKWDGNKVVRYRPDGTVDFELMLPVRRPTSTMFVGADLSTLAVTSANLDRTADGALAGAVFLIPTQTFGLPEARAVVPSEGRPIPDPLL